MISKQQALTQAAALIDWHVEHQLDTLALNLRVQGFDDDEIHAILREARVFNTQAVRDAMCEVERFVNKAYAGDTGELMFMPTAQLSWPPTIH